ncbi:hypothetical protein BC834DRAFT_842690 [Gloeopeniophorella convolvens]|nr:hypothetical protein BC834DRAFT_842690 [Gloeopeniophorella convolvens]
MSRPLNPAGVTSRELSGHASSVRDRAISADDSVATIDRPEHSRQRYLTEPWKAAYAVEPASLRLPASRATTPSDDEESLLETSEDERHAAVQLYAATGVFETQVVEEPLQDNIAASGADLHTFTGNFPTSKDSREHFDQYSEVDNSDSDTGDVDTSLAPQSAPGSHIPGHDGAAKTVQDLVDHFLEGRSAPIDASQDNAAKTRPQPKQHKSWRERLRRHGRSEDSGSLGHELTPAPWQGAAPDSRSVADDGLRGKIVLLQSGSSNAVSSSDHSNPSPSDPVTRSEDPNSTDGLGESQSQRPAEPARVADLIDPVNTYLPPSRPASPSQEHEDAISEASRSNMPVAIAVPSVLSASSSTPVPAPPGKLPSLDHVPDPLAEAWDMVKDGPKKDDKDKKLRSVEDKITEVKNNIDPLVPQVTAEINALKQSKVTKDIEREISYFREGVPLLMNALDEVQKLHPFIHGNLLGTVMIFKTVYTLEANRRDNEKKIIALFVKMKDMMAVLIRLKDVRDENRKAPDGRFIEDRLKYLVDITGKQIMECSKTCDAYAKKRLLAKVIQGPLWNQKFADYIRLFSERHGQFQAALTIHLTQSIDRMDVKLDDVGANTRIIEANTRATNEKMTELLSFLEGLVSPEQSRLSRLVDAKGGVEAVKGNDKMLLYLEQKVTRTALALNAEGRYGVQIKPTSRTAPSVDELRQDVLEKPEDAVKNNDQSFSRKFKLQKRQIVDELGSIVQRETDRVIKGLKDGPHARVHDPNWRGNVKARHFVLALRDHYLEKLALEDGTYGAGAAAHKASDEDAWAITFMDITWLQPILEAFDDDASGFITISEMNRFTDSSPQDWSLARWIAYWAIGFKSSIIDYATKIEDLFSKMEGLRAEVLLPNRQAFDEYFHWVWMNVHTLTAAVTPLQASVADRDKFAQYISAEEDRIKRNLEGISYVIDGVETVALIAETPGRIEKTVFPLLYLLVKRHYEIMRAMRTKVLDPRELEDAQETIFCVTDVIESRTQHLNDIFLQQKLDVEKQFRTFAFGMFKYVRDKKELWSPAYFRSLESPVTKYDHATEEPRDSESEIVLKYGATEVSSSDDRLFDASAWAIGSPKCIEARVVGHEDAEGVVHEPSHHMIKIRAPILARQYGRIYTSARAAIKRAEEECSRHGSSKVFKDKSNTEANGHTEEHPLILCRSQLEKPDDAILSTEQRLAAVENHLDRLAGRMGSIEQLLDKLAGARENPSDDIAHRVGNVERLLERLTSVFRLERVP